ncbi:MAG: isopentenyl phosphate kinase, partial [Candidatus Paceibacterota bacterium]
MNSITILKLGGSLITDKSKPYTPRVDIINNLALQIRSAVKADSNLSLIIGNGGGSFPHYPAHFYKMKQGISTKRQIMGYAKVQDAAARLNRIIVKALLEAGVEAVSLQPSSMIIAREGRVAKFFVDPFIELLKKNIVPVFYGDIVMDTKRGSTIFS